jgi:polygalacturonase
MLLKENHDLRRPLTSSQTIKNSPVQVFSINGATNTQFNGLTVNNKDGDTQGGHNTDAFDVGASTGITISGATVYNQDDCLAVNSGTDITFTGGYCSGGHGLSIGSVGGRDNNVVDTVKILDSQIVNSDNGVRIKAVSGATGKITGVTYSNIKLSNVSDIPTTSSICMPPQPSSNHILTLPSRSPSTASSSSRTTRTARPLALLPLAFLSPA